MSNKADNPILSRYINIKMEKEYASVNSSGSLQKKFLKYLGPRVIYGYLDIDYKPSREFIFNSEVEWPEESYEDAVIEGLLDVILDSSRPLLGVEITLKDIKWHKIDSSYYGYQMAAREIAEELLCKQ